MAKRLFSFAHMLRWLAILNLALPLVAAEPLRVSSFSTVLTEIAQQVGGDRVVVTGHVKAGVDPHDFEPKPADLKTVSSAQLVLLSAKHLEGYVGKLKQATGTAGVILEVGDKFPSLKVATDAGSHGHDHDHRHDHGSEDPHWWHSVANAKRATKVIRDALIQLSPEDKAFFVKNADAYTARLDALQQWVAAKVAELPRNQRKLVTSHDAFGYFAKENGFTVFPIEGLAAGEQPSSKKVAAIIAAIKAQGVKAVFTEDIHNPKVLAEITRETGVKIGGELLSDGLGAEPGKDTYEGMIKHNVATIVDALK
jgi:ABC-type Zn uptake system ZnuABC Zn-binding protein ZnuA